MLHRAFMYCCFIICSVLEGYSSQSMTPGKHERYSSYTVCNSRPQILQTQHQWKWSNKWSAQTDATRLACSCISEKNCSAPGWIYWGRTYRPDWLQCIRLSFSCMVQKELILQSHFETVRSEAVSKTMKCFLLHPQITWCAWNPSGHCGGQIVELYNWY